MKTHFPFLFSALLAGVVACSGESIVGGRFDATTAADSMPDVNAPDVKPDVMVVDDRPVDPPDVIVVDDLVDASDVADADDADAEEVDVFVRCTSDMACLGNPEGGVCDMASGRCVQCLPTSDTCPSDRFCDPATNTCFAGCRNDDGCAMPDADGGVSATPRCVTSTHTCVACLLDSHCPSGTLCRGNVCVAGCDMSRACPAGQSCCSGGCQDTQSNVGACGMCGRTCSVNNGVPSCVMGACGLDRCNMGFGDCNLNIMDGCETNLLNDITACGSCGRACTALDNATTICRGGSCIVGLCSGGFGDCDGTSANGCEIELRADPSNCGACGMRCPAVANASPTCTMNRCGFSCLPGFADCDGNAANGCEANTRTSATTCGACTTACRAGPNSTAACTAGVCTIGSCTAGFADCDGTAANGCEVNTAITNTHCGRCGTVCPTGQVCTAGRCGLPCPTGQTSCGTACRVLANDPANCGACGRACTTGQLCGDGTCRATCGPGQMICGRSCATVATDPTNCGRCGNVCPSGQSCVAGACTLICPTGQTACGLLCIDVMTDNSHCGRCGNVCRSTDRCTAGVCTLVCPTGQTNCGGVCVDTMTNAAHCGMCGRVCTSGCYMGACGALAAMDSSRYGSCIFYTSGRVFCFGYRNGLLPSSSTSLYHYWTPQIVNDGLGRPFDTAVQMVVAQDRGCVRARDGSVQCWGAGSNVGNVSGLLDIVDIDGRENNNFLAATRDGRVFTWNGVPRPTSNPATAIAGIADAVQVAGGNAFGCARTATSTVRCWGTNTSGQLGNGTMTNSTAPVVVTGLTNAIHVAAGFNHACAIRMDRTVVCWGANNLGQIGDNTTMNRNVPTVVTGLTTVQQIRAGIDYTCAVLADGSVRCWGANSYGQLGRGTMTPSALTAAAVTGLPASRHVTVYEHHSCAIGRDNMVRCWGQNFWGEGGGGTEAQTSPIAVRGLTGVTDLQGGNHGASGSELESHKCALLSGGGVQCWGSVWSNSNSYGQYGDGTAVARATPGPVTGLTDATQITVSGNYNCALRRGGTVVCWGLNNRGQLGDGTTTTRMVPTAVPGIANVAEVRAGGAHTCVRHTNGTVSCWGYNFEGELGDGTMTDRATPRIVPGVTTAVQLQLGSNHTCARLMDGRVQCWGRNIEGQLADGSNTNRFVPTYITFIPTGGTATSVTGVTALRCDAQNTVCYARLMDGSARLWGGNNRRVVADGNGVINVPQWESVGFGVTCQYRTDNNLYCTGSNEFGQVGIGRQSSSEAYTVVPGMYSRVQSGSNSGIPCAIERTTGRVLCWGPTRNNYLNNAGTPALDGYTRSPAVVPIP